MFRKDHYTFWLKHRIFYLELSVLHKLYVFIPPSGPDSLMRFYGHVTPCKQVNILFMLVMKLAYCRSYDAASRQPGPRQPLHVSKIALSCFA